jgi:hypothetical protein
MVPCGSPLRTILDTKLADPSPRRAITILTTIAGLTWTQQGFSASWGKTQARAGTKGLTFNDLRGTAVLRLAFAGCTVPEIAAITGHSLRDAQTILDANYFHRDQALAESAMRKLETRFGKQDASDREGAKQPRSNGKTRPLAIELAFPSGMGRGRSNTPAIEHRSSTAGGGTITTHRPRSGDSRFVTRSQPFDP